MYEGCTFLYKGLVHLWTLVSVGDPVDVRVSVLDFGSELKFDYTSLRIL